MSRRYRIKHITTYTYSDRVTSSYGRGFLAPRDMDGQHCVEKSVTVEPAPTDQSFGVDVYGNEDVYFHVTNDHEKLVVTADSLVEVYPRPVHRLWSSLWICRPRRSPTRYAPTLHPASGPVDRWRTSSSI
jgi:transglutaminase-like putative cysteine protease